MISESQIEKNVEGRVRDVIWGNSREFSWGIKENHENLQSSYSASGPGFKPGTSGMWSSSANHSPVMYGGLVSHGSIFFSNCSLFG
jgi:hypothetical protein